MEFTTKAESETFYVRKSGDPGRQRLCLIEVRLPATDYKATGSGDYLCSVVILGKFNYSYASNTLASATYVHKSWFFKFSAVLEQISPAFSLGWRIQNEPFLENVDFLSDQGVKIQLGT